MLTGNPPGAERGLGPSPPRWVRNAGEKTGPEHVKEVHEVRRRSGSWSLWHEQPRTLFFAVIRDSGSSAPRLLPCSRQLARSRP
jgi:hypothetical protein